MRSRLGLAPAGRCPGDAITARSPCTVQRGIRLLTPALSSIEEEREKSARTHCLCDVTNALAVPVCRSSLNGNGQNRIALEVQAATGEMRAPEDLMGKMGRQLTLEVVQCQGERGKEGFDFERRETRTCPNLRGYPHNNRKDL